MKMKFAEKSHEHAAPKLWTSGSPVPAWMRLRSSGRTLAIWALAACAGIFASPALGQQSYCSEPVKPACVDVNSTSNSEMSISRCQQAVDDYAEEVEAYFECLEKRKENLKAEIKEMREKLAELQPDNS